MYSWYQLDLFQKRPFLLYNNVKLKTVIFIWFFAWSIYLKRWNWWARQAGHSHCPGTFEIIQDQFYNDGTEFRIHLCIQPSHAWFCLVVEPNWSSSSPYRYFINANRSKIKHSILSRSMAVLLIVLQTKTLVTKVMWQMFYLRPGLPNALDIRHEFGSSNLLWSGSNFCCFFCIDNFVGSPDLKNLRWIFF